MRRRILLWYLKCLQHPGKCPETGIHQLIQAKLMLFFLKMFLNRTVTLAFDLSEPLLCLSAPFNTLLQIKDNSYFMTFIIYTCKTCVKRPLSKRLKIGFQDKLFCLMQVKSIAECSKGSILQYFRPSLRYNWSLRSLFVCFTQVLLYM